MPKKTDFYRLPRPVQDRFAAATRRKAPPAPLLFRPAPRTRVWVHLGASGVLVLVALVLLRVGFGDVQSPLALHGPRAMAVDMLLLAGAAYGVLHAAAVLRTADSMPWKPGIYLFPACVIDATEPSLLVWPLGDAEAVEATSSPEPGLVLRMRDGSRVLVPTHSLADAQQAQSALESQRDELARATASQDPHMLAELDPLHDSALSSPIGPSEAMKRTTQAWIRLDWALAAALGAALGFAVGETRNSMSDEAMYRAMATTGTVAQYRQYLAHKGRHSADVGDVLLPRAELRDAEAQGTVDAVRDFARAHTASKISAEIDASLRKAMLAELEKAKKAGSVAVLDDFARKYPDRLVDKEFKPARHALYVKALASWADKAQVDAATRAFMDRLLAWAEKSGPGCEVRFRFRPSKTIDDADKSVMKSGHFPGPDALPSKYVTAEAMHPREQRVAQSLAKALAAAFPADVLAVQAGEPLAPDAGPPTNLPLLLIDYSPDWSRANTASTKPPTVFAGLNFTFDTTFTLPDGIPPLKVTTKAWRGAELWKIKADDLSREDYEAKVYDAMIDGAFDTLDKKLADAFF